MDRRVSLDIAISFEAAQRHEAEIAASDHPMCLTVRPSARGGFDPPGGDAAPPLQRRVGSHPPTHGRGTKTGDTWAPPGGTTTTTTTIAHGPLSNSASCTKHSCYGWTTGPASPSHRGPFAYLPSMLLVLLVLRKHSRSSVASKPSKHLEKHSRSDVTSRPLASLSSMLLVSRAPRETFYILCARVCHS